MRNPSQNTGQVDAIKTKRPLKRANEGNEKSVKKAKVSVNEEKDKVEQIEKFTAIPVSTQYRNTVTRVAAFPQDIGQ